MFLTPHVLHIVPLCIVNLFYHFYKSDITITIGLWNYERHIGHVTFCP